MPDQNKDHEEANLLIQVRGIEQKIEPIKTLIIPVSLLISTK